MRTADNSTSGIAIVSMLHEVLYIYIFIHRKR